MFVDLDLDDQNNVPASIFIEKKLKAGYRPNTTLSRACEAEVMGNSESFPNCTHGRRNSK